MSVPDDVPRTEYGSSQLGVRDCRFTLRSSRDVRRHDRSRLGDADVDEMHHADASRRRRGGLHRGEVHAQKFRRLRRARVRVSDQMHQRVGGPKCRGQRPRVERIAGDRQCSRGLPVDRLRTRQGANAMPACDKSWYQPLPDIAGAAGHEDVACGHRVPVACTAASAADEPA